VWYCLHICEANGVDVKPLIKTNNKIFVIKFSGVSDLQGVKVPDFPLTLLVIVTTVLRYRAACDKPEF